MKKNGSKNTAKNLVLTGVSALILWNSQAFSEAGPTEDATTTTISVAKGPKASPLEFALDLQFVPIRYPQYYYTPGVRSQNMGMAARIAFEYVPLVSIYGKASMGAGVGYGKIGKVNIADGVQSSLETLPVDVYVTYRGDYLTDQAIVPFLKGGLETHFARQAASDGTKQYNGLNWGFGLSLLLDRLDRGSANQLDGSTGINNTYLTFEYLNSSSLASTPQINLARDEMRVGLRFEM